MGIMDNFKQAVNELAGQEEQGEIGFLPQQDGADDQEVSFRDILDVQEELAGVVDAAGTVETAETAENEGVRVISGLGGGISSMFAQSLDAAVNRSPASASNTTVIAPGTVIDGNISSTEDLTIFGVVNGDVINARKLVIHGEVAGSISAIDISLIDSIISGNVVSQNSTEMTKDSCILGDLTTQNVVVSGKVKGNIEAKGNGIFKKDSIVLGNISVGTIVIEGGARMRGFVTTTDGDKEVDEDFFPQK